jgi:hypothetical protein
LTSKEKDYVLKNLDLLHEALKVKKLPHQVGAPELIAIDQDDYHAELVGTTASGQQFFITNLFRPASADSPRQEYLAVFLFNEDGDLVDSKVDIFPPGNLSPDELERFEQLQELRLSELGEVSFQDILVKPFAVEHHGEMMGLVPVLYGDEQDEDGWVVEIIPGRFMAFNPPWDSGKYEGN